MSAPHPLLSIIVPVYSEVATSPMAEIGAGRIYRPGDRERYLRGVQPPTESAR